jgi:hypothetical protein
MSISIFMCISTECSSLNHVDKAWLELKRDVVRLKCWSSTNVPNTWSRELKQGLVSHGFTTSVDLLLGWVDLVI